MLTKAGKEVMIKLVLQSLPTYFMSLFLIPSTMIDEIERMLNGFWWDDSGSRNKGIRWLAWDKLCMAKEDGGLGFRILKAFNLALLGKQAWCLMTQPDLLVSHLYKARYFPHCELLDAGRRSHGSYVWNSIIDSKVVLNEGAIWNRWAANRCSIKLRHHGLCNPFLRVDYLVNSDSKGWNDNLVCFLLDDISIAAVLKTPLYPCVTSDFMSWRCEKSGWILSEVPRG